MTYYPYDPDLPFAVVGKVSKKVYARFFLEGSASDWASTREGLKVIDTTPKPRIPDDAEFVILDYGGQSFLNIRQADGGWRDAGGETHSTQEMEAFAENAVEIIVLDRRKDDA